jgi:flagellar motility protein MotE (MotC chaperone)
MKRPQLKAPRLLPVVIAAGAALLLFKGIGILSGDGYVLTGPSAAIAAGGGGGHGGGEEAATGGEGGDTTMSLPSDPSLEDTSPTLEDTSVTLGEGEKAESGDHGGSGDKAKSDEHAAEGEHTAEGDAKPAAEGAATACPPTDAAAAAAEAGHSDAKASGEHGEAAEGEAAAATDCIPTTASGDALPMMTNGAGEVVPVSDATAGSTPQILERLGERRTELDNRAAELDAREALLAATERQLEEKNAALKALEEQLAQKELQTKAEDGQQMAALVTMYEQMKPKDAALILGQLDLETLTRVAKAISPRKMGPILARMDPAKAEALTAALAAVPVADNDMAATDLGQLPQIVGN